MIYRGNRLTAKKSCYCKTKLTAYTDSNCIPAINTIQEVCMKKLITITPLFYIVHDLHIVILWFSTCIVILPSNVFA